MAGEASQRFVFGLEGSEVSPRERAAFAAQPPFGFLLFRRNLSSASQSAELISELRGLCSPSPLLFVDQEGGTVDRIGPLLGISFPSAETAAAAGTDRVHEIAFLMGRAARLLGFDVDLAPVLDLAQPGTGAVVLAGRCFGFHPEDVTLAATVFLHGPSTQPATRGVGRGLVEGVVTACEIQLPLIVRKSIPPVGLTLTGAVPEIGAVPGLYPLTNWLLDEPVPPVGAEKTPPVPLVLVRICQ